MIILYLFLAWLIPILVIYIILYINWNYNIYEGETFGDFCNYHHNKLENIEIVFFIPAVNILVMIDLIITYIASILSDLNIRIK